MKDDLLLEDASFELSDPELDLFPGKDQRRQAKGLGSTVKAAANNETSTQYRSTPFHPGVAHNHSPSGKWSQIQSIARRSCDPSSLRTVLSEITRDPSIVLDASRMKSLLLKLPSRSANNCACAVLSPSQVAAVAGIMSFALPLARKHFHHYLNGSGADLWVDLGTIIRTDNNFRLLIAKKIAAASTGHFTISQGDYGSSKELQYALGAIDRVDYEVIGGKSGAVRLWFKDRYEWHPVYPGIYQLQSGDIIRDTNCIHAAMVECKRDMGARDYWMVADVVLPYKLFATASSGYVPSRQRKHFASAVARGDWKQAFLMLNGLNMYEMLRALNELTPGKRTSLFALRKQYSSLINLPRIEYALTVVRNRRLPSVAPGDLAKTGQVKTAAEFLAALAGTSTQMSGNPFREQFEKAAHHVGVPESWASNPALCQLVRHESQWNPQAKNPGSSAFGLFQFIKSTWKRFLPEVPYGNTDPYWQAVGGLRYIKAAYGTPERAWAFWQATVRKKPSLAPTDLRAKAKQWVSKGWGGYEIQPIEGMGS